MSELSRIERLERVVAAGWRNLPPPPANDTQTAAAYQELLQIVREVDAREEVARERRERMN